MSDERTQDQRLAEARERKAKRELAVEGELKARELEVLECEEKLEQTQGGPRGKAFEIVETDYGVFAVKLGEYVQLKAFQAKKNPGPEDVHQFVRPLIVYPSAEAFDKVAGARPLVAVRCADAAAKLFGAKEADSRSKY